MSDDPEPNLADAATPPAAQPGEELPEDLVRRGQAEFVAGFMALLAAVLLSVAACWAVAVLHGPVVGLTPEEARATFVCPPEELQPEPVERGQYLAVLLVFPLALWAVRRWLVRRLSRRLETPVGRPYRLGQLAAGVLAVCLVALAYFGERSSPEAVTFLNSLLLCRGAGTVLDSLAAGFAGLGAALAGLGLDLVWLALAGAGLAVLAWFSDGTFLADKPVARRVLHWGLALPAVVLLTGMLLAQSFQIYPCAVDFQNVLLVHHFNAVFHAVVQVCQGQALLVDLNHQYGLYPHFLAPLLRAVGLSVVTFTLVMAGLNVLAHYGLYRLMKEAGGNAVLALAGLCALALLFHLPRYTTCAEMTPQTEPYFQFQPIRTLFPWLAMYLLWQRLIASTGRGYWLCLVLLACGVLWNLDAGIVVYVAWTLALAHDELCLRSDWRAAARKIAGHVAAAVLVLGAVVLAFSLYIRAGHGAWPDYRQVFEYQRIFYIAGCGMLPMPAIGLWLAVALIYALGLLRGCRGILSGQRRPKDTLFLFLAVLGCGVFSYYQGRSHFMCLLAVSYPAVVMAVIWTAEVVTRWRQGLRPAWLETSLAAAVIVALASSLVDTIRYGPAIHGPAVRATVSAWKGEARKETSNAEFLREYFRPGGKALILSFLSGEYYLESRTTCPLRIPGYSELILQRDWATIRAWLTAPHPDQLVALDAYYLGADRTELWQVLHAEPVLAKYRVLNVSPAGNLVVLEPPDTGRPQWDRKWPWPALEPAPGTVKHYRVDNRSGAAYSVQAGLEGLWNADPVKPGKEFSIEVVARPEPEAAGQAGYLLGNSLSSAAPVGFCLFSDGQGWRFQFGDGQQWHAIGGLAPQPGVWNYLTVSMDGQRLRVFLNGKPAGEADAPAALRNSPAPLLFGNWQAADKRSLSRIDEVRLSSRPLTFEEHTRNWTALRAKGVRPLDLRFPTGH